MIFSLSCVIRGRRINVSVALSIKQVTEVEMVSEFGVNDVILDIRSPEEQETSPLKIDGIDRKIKLLFFRFDLRFDGFHCWAF